MKVFLVILMFVASCVYAQEDKGTTVADIQKIVNDTLASKWYEKIQMKGYAHFRYNRFLESNKNYASPSTDKSIGNKKGFYLRRARLTFFGEVSNRV